jgi:hypothetical protein
MILKTAMHTLLVLHQAPASGLWQLRMAALLLTLDADAISITE